MPKATCRCGATLEIPREGADRVVCPQCSAKVRIRRDPPKAAVDPNDGFIRFDCPCGRRLKVREGNPAQQAGKCPDCGRVVPVPAKTPFANLKSYSSTETPTDEMGPEERAAIASWSAKHLNAKQPVPAAVPALDPRAASTVLEKPSDRAVSTASGPPSTTKVEAGLRVCPRCGRPLHLSAVACRECGAPAPRR